MNTAAVKAWERRKSSNLQKISDRPKRQRQRRRRSIANRDCTASDTAVEKRRPQPQHISKTPSHETNNSSSSYNKRGISRTLDQAPSHSTFSHTGIIVQVSQHSNFNKDLYVAYQSSLSTQGNSQSLIPYPLSASALAEFSQNSIVPDSQSLAGSSSYQPTLSTSSAVLGVDQASLTQKSRVLHNSTDLESSTGDIAEANDSIEDSSAVVVAASQPSFIASERSRSEPAPSTRESSSGSHFGAQFPSLPRSTSDPTSTHHDQHRRRAIVSGHPTIHHIANNQTNQRSLGFQSPHRTAAGHIQQRQRSSEVQVPGSADRISCQNPAVDDSSAHSLVFQTQVSLAFASQGSRVSIPAAGTSELRFNPSIKFQKEQSSN